jgi:hypothetical protein
MSPISFSRPVESVKEQDEPHDTFEERTWRERLHSTSDGQVLIPPMALKNCITDVAQYLSENIPGKGRSKYTKHFKAGILTPEPLLLTCNDKPIMAADVQSERLFVPSDGKRGGGSRVWKFFPIIHEWQASATIIILDPVLIAHHKKIEEYLKHAGQFIGMGRFRAINNGYYGRFVVLNVKFVTMKKVA